ncbi:MAG TPA: hypothetical protein VFZ56_02605 [Gemmatimonadaceae bacterium]
MSYVVTPLLDETDTSQRIRQHVLIFGGVLDVVIGVALASGMISYDAVVRVAGLAVIAGGVAMVLLASRIRQRWQAGYQGHRIRFENDPIFGEKLFIDDHLVARGGLGFSRRLEGDIQSGPAAGDRIVALSEARLTSFRCRIEAHTPRTRARDRD